ncbi:MAG TPA: glycosyl hydrolase [Sulfurimonas autotrophica]|uniref:Glycosyl hydrolase n=1 Tax=Sulfurimonas autotrophica TaxID=202747 RepID=A0A7C3GBY4_9BACT|nr:glycosyl hydrolase [Sulfurimonas autotrophica]
MKKPFKWDNYSDQPALLKDRDFKKKMRKKERSSLLYTIISALIFLPLSLLAMPFVKRKEIDTTHFFSLGVDFEREPVLTQALLEELEVENILLRLKLWEMDKLPELKAFAKQNQEKKIILKIMQDREHIEDLTLLQNDLRAIFSELREHVDIFEIGTTINRAKWGFFSAGEYLRFYKVAYDLKIFEFNDIELIGSGVIDFELYYTVHTLFNFCKCKYDGVASLLYVDRRGAPENTQLGFSLTDKIALLSTMVWLSPKTKQKLYITETNWPISGTAPYAPTSEYECVSEAAYSDYMLRYYLLSFASQQVDSVSWHQLIAPGYGLIDNREGIKRREAFYVYKYMLSTLKNAQFLRLDIKRGYYIMQFWVDEQLLQLHWSLSKTTLKNEDFFEVYSKTGERIEDEILEIGSAPLYIFITKEVGQKVNASERIG